jgi:hypothetical protein
MANVGRLIHSLGAVTLLAILMGCSDSSSSGGGHENPPAKPPTQPSSDAPGATVPSGRKEATGSITPSKSCKDWDLTSNPDFKELTAQGFKISLDCSALRFDVTYGSVSESSAFAMLGQLKSELSKIQALATKPTKILLTNGTLRNLGDDTWRLSITRNPNEELTNFLASEKILQPIEQRLYSGKVSLYKPSIGGVAERINEHDLAKAVTTLEKLSTQIKQAANNGSVRIVKIELGTNMTKELWFIRYNSGSNMIELPYEANAESLEYFIANVIPAAYKFQQLVKFPVDSELLQGGILKAMLTQRENQQLFKHLTNQTSSIFNSLATIAPKISALTSSSNSIMIRLNLLEDLDAIGEHGISNNMIQIYAANRVLSFTEKVDIPSLESCLDALKQNPSGRHSECRVMFNR